jgi:hypothetical protein
VTGVHGGIATIESEATQAGHRIIRNAVAEVAVD